MGWGIAIGAFLVLMFHTLDELVRLERGSRIEGVRLSDLWRDSPGYNRFFWIGFLCVLMGITIGLLN